MTEPERGVLPYRWRPARPGSYTVGRKSAIRSILLHSTDGNIPGCIETLTGHDAERPEISVHWLVGRDGTVYHFVSDNCTAYHAGKVVDPMWSNSASVGIEQEHMDGQEVWPDGQVQSVARLCAAILQKHGLAAGYGADPHVIVGHAEAAPGRKTDPEGYPWASFRTYVLAALRWQWSLVRKGA